MLAKPTSRSRSRGSTATTATTATTPTATPSEHTIAVQQVYKNFGRDSEVGRRLFAIYNKKIDYDPKVNIKSKSQPTQPYQEQLLRQKEQQQAIRARLNAYQRKLTPARPERQAVFWSGGKKPAAAIEAEVSANPIIYRPVPMSPEESMEYKKQHLQQKMSGLDISSESTDIAAKKTRQRKADDFVSEAQQLTQSVLYEIQSRQELLDQMTATEQEAEHRDAIIAEIAQLMKDLQMLDELRNDTENKRATI